MKTFCFLLMSCLILGLSGTGCGPKKTDPPEVQGENKKNQQMLVGTWKVAEGEADGAFAAGTVLRFNEYGTFNNGKVDFKDMKKVEPSIKEVIYKIEHGHDLKLTRIKEGKLKTTIEKTLTIKSIDDEKLVLADAKGKTQELKKISGGSEAYFKANIGGVWETPAKGADGSTSIDEWYVTAEESTDSYTDTIKSLTDKELVIISTDTPTKFKRKGAAPTGAKTNKEKLVGQWEITEGQTPFFIKYTQDGKVESGLIRTVGPNKKVEIVDFLATYVVDGAKFTTTVKFDGKGKIWNKTTGKIEEFNYQIKGSTFYVAGGDVGVWAIKSLSHEKMVLEQDGKIKEFKRREPEITETPEPTESKKDQIVGTWTVVKSDLGWAAGTAWELTKDGKGNIDINGVKVSGNYKIEGDTFKWTPPGKGEIPMAITTLTPTQLILVVDQGGKKLTNEFKKK